MKDNLVELVDGRKVRIRPISHILLGEIGQNVLREFRERNEPITPPTYRAAMAGGAEQEYQHTDETLEYPVSLAMKETDDPAEAECIAAERTEVAKLAWAQYIDALRRLQAETNERQFVYAFDEGIVPDTTGQAWNGEIPDGWLERQRRYGFIAPEDENDRRLWYILRGLLPTVSDQVKVFTEIFALTSRGIQNDQIEAAMKFFRREVEGETVAS